MNSVSRSGSSSPYQPLSAGEIRILILEPGDPDAPLEAQLETRSLESPGRNGKASGGVRDGAGYEAISYCWGPAMFPGRLQVNDGSSITLTHNLYSALLAFRLADRPRYLWVDAVCINQRDLSERSSQVRLMGSIYATADRVLVWLGEQMQDANETLAFVVLTAPIVAKGDRSRRELLKIIEDHLRSTTHCKCCSATPSVRISLEMGLLAVAKLLERPWFGRLWVVQEVALAREIIVHCGSHFVSWEVFTEVARVPGQFDVDHAFEDQHIPFNTPRGVLRTIWAHCNYLNQLRSRNQSILSDRDSFKPTALCKDLLMLSRLDCQDPHDRIYGVGRVLGLDAFENLRANYSISVSELYRRVVELSLTAPANRPGGRAVVMLALAKTELPPAATLARPSWVPHLQYLSDRSRSKYTFYQWAVAERQYYADAAEFFCKISPDDSQLLLVRGRQFGRVSMILDGSACPSKQIHRRTAQKCSDQEAVELIQWYVRCCRFLETNLVPYDHNPCPTEEISQRARQIFRLPHTLIKTSERRSLPSELVTKWLALFPTIAGDVGKANEVADGLSPYITGYPYDREQNLCILDTQYGHRAAWIPSSAEPGDDILHFIGAPYPFIVRGVANNNGVELQGDALVIDLEENDMLGVGALKWSSAKQQVHQADADLKMWMESSDRAALKREREYQRLRNKDQSYKNLLVDAMSRLKAFYADADETHEWIKVR